MVEVIDRKACAAATGQERELGAHAQWAWVVQEEEKVLEVDDCVGCPTMCTYLMPLNNTPENS